MEYAHENIVEKGMKKKGTLGARRSVGKFSRKA